MLCQEESSISSFWCSFSVVEPENFASSGCSHNVSRWDSNICPSFTWNLNPVFKCRFPISLKIKLTIGCKRNTSPIWRNSEFFKGRRCKLRGRALCYGPHVLRWNSSEDLTICINAAGIKTRASSNVLASNWLLNPRIGTSLEEINSIEFVANKDCALVIHGCTLKYRPVRV